MKEEKTFEQSLNELENIAGSLEKGNLSLEEAIIKFEEGMKISKTCTQKLDEAEKKINILVQNENLSYKEEDFLPEE